MTEKTTEHLYNLLPAIYRIRDIEQGESLRALLAVIEREMQAIEKDIDGLYDNLFIETCDEWVVPYIGDLMGVQGLHTISPGDFSLRPYVANTLAYRRRKGTAVVLEQLARDVTGWPARAVEFFKLLSVSQHFNHVTLRRGKTLDLRDQNQLELLNGPFENAAHTADVRSIASHYSKGKYNIPNIGLFLWRLQPYSISRSAARPVVEPNDGRYTFDPLGLDIPLFNQPQTETEIIHLAEEMNVPGILRRRLLYDELETLRKSLTENLPLKRVYFGGNQVFEVFVQNIESDTLRKLFPEEILICNLSDWRRPSSRTYIRADNTEFATQVAVDPVLGRLVFLDDEHVPARLDISYTYGFPADVGGGPYNRQDSVAKWYDPDDMNNLNKQVTWQMGVTKDKITLDEAPDPNQLEESLQIATSAWKEHALSTPNAFGIITIMDSSTYKEDLTIEIPASSKLAIVAADWPVVTITGPPEIQQRFVGQLMPESIRPHLQGNLSIKVTNDGPVGELVLDGLLVEGKLTIKTGDFGMLSCHHCTLVPGKGGIIIEMGETPDTSSGQTVHPVINIHHSIVDSINLADTVLDLDIMDSIVDVPDGEAINAVRARAQIQTSTIFGSITTQRLEASNSIFMDMVDVERQQVGCIRFCSLSDIESSRFPRRYHCQPDLALKDIPDTQTDERAHVKARLKPLFFAKKYGNPAYAQLSTGCAKEIRTGAEDGSEMGVFSKLKQPQREANIRTALEEYLPFGLDVGIFDIT